MFPKDGDGGGGSDRRTRKWQHRHFFKWRIECAYSFTTL